MSTDKVLIDEKSADKAQLDAFLQTMTKSSSRRKILVRFKFKYVGTEFLEWLTYRQYDALRTIDCLEFCSTIT
ncbi:MAG: hypothetical protein KGH89_01870 [Thaumarchaeota archaeon]|nr:hypothetical protein [Nitrososphaerota archaeon]MDE1867278.1 hypothetical protein [Nitrososphaerota archaeon]